MIDLNKRVDEWLAQDYRLMFYERVQYAVEAENMFKDLPEAIRYAKTFEYILQKMTVIYEDDRMFVGKVKRVIPTQEQRDEALGHYMRWWGVPEEEFQKTAYFCYSFKKNTSTWIAAKPPWMISMGHLAFDWEYLLENGLNGFRKRIEERKELENTEDQKNYLEGLRICIDAVEDYMMRYAQAAKECGNVKRSQMLERIIKGTPETFYEVLQYLLLFQVGIKRVLSYEAPCMGRMDQYLKPYYDRDIKAGNLTREQALEMIEEYMFKDIEDAALFDHMSPDAVETQVCLDVSTEDIPYYIIGGRTLDGKSCVNELSHLFIEAAHDLKKLKAPVIIVRYFDGIEKDFFTKVAEAVKDNSSIFIFNDETQIPALTFYGVKPEDAAEYGMFSCNNPTIPAKMGSLRQIWFNLAIPLELVFGRGKAFAHTNNEEQKKDCEFSLKDRLMGMMESGYNGVDTGSLADMKSMDDFLQAYKKQLEYLISELRKGLEIDGAVEKEMNKGRIRIEDCFLKGTIENACDWVTGGTEYHKFMVNAGGLATIVDSLYAVEQLVFVQKKVTMEQLADALRNNFEGYEELQNYIVKKLDKFGNDCLEVDKYAKTVVEMFTDLLKKYNEGDYLYDMMGAVSTLRDFSTEGLYVGATPNGRKAGEPLSENQSPSAGEDVSGLTALLNSVSKIPFYRATGGPLNVRIHPSALAGSEGTKNLEAVMRSYFENGGFQLQISCVGAETLRKAQAEPEKYRDLTVRVTGYNAYFTRMGAEAQNEFISRTEQMVS